MAWNGSTNVGGTTPAPKKPAKKSPSLAHGLIAGVLVCVFIVITYFVMFSGEEDGAGDVSDCKRGKISEAGLSRVDCDSTESERAIDSSSSACRGGDGANVLSDNNDTIGLELSDLPMLGDMPTPPPSKEAFDNPSDQLISMTINGNGGPIAPLPFSDNMDEAFRKSLEKPILISDEDSEEVKEAKRRVIEAREDIKALLKEGKSVRQILEEHRDDVNFKAEIRSQTMREARTILESGDEEGAKEFVTMMNLALQQKGIEEIEMPLTKEQRREQILERALERKAQKEMNP